MIRSITNAAIAPPKTKKSSIIKIILGFCFFAEPAVEGAAGAPEPGGDPMGGAPAGDAPIGAPPGGGKPMGGPPGAAPGAGAKLGPPLGASSAGLGPPAGERDGAAGTGEGRPGAAPGDGVGKDGVKLGVGAPPTLGKDGERDKPGALGAGATGTADWIAGTGAGVAAAGIAGVGIDGTGAGVGLGVAGGAGLGAADADIGAGVPSVGFALGAKGDRVTRNLGAPSPGFTGAPCLGVSLRAGFGGVGKPSDIYKLIQRRNQFRARKRFTRRVCFFLINQKFLPLKFLQLTVL